MQRSTLVPKISLRFEAKEWLSVSVVLVVTVILSLNLVRVVARASENYDVYVAEGESLAQLEEINEDLTRELAYFQSYEYKKLYARDNLRLAEAGELLFDIEDSEIYELSVTEYNLLAEQPNLELWRVLF